MKAPNEDLTAKVAKLKAQLRRSRARNRKLKAPPTVIHETQKKAPYSIAPTDGRAASGGDRRVIVLVAGNDVGEILRKIA